MKKVIVIPFLLLTATILFAQEQNTSFLNKKNEIKINLPVSIFGQFLDASYERILQEDISVGASLGYAISDDYGLKSQFSPYFRWFFGGNSESQRKYAAGFFVEANSSVFSKYVNTDENGTTRNSKFGAGVGLGIGWKYISKNNWCGEILFGGGRDFINDGIYPHIGIYIGKRF